MMNKAAKKRISILIAELVSSLFLSSNDTEEVFNKRRIIKEANKLIDYLNDNESRYHGL